MAKKKAKYHMEITKSESGLRGWSVLTARGREVYFDTSMAEAANQCDELNGVDQGCAWCGKPHNYLKEAVTESGKSVCHDCTEDSADVYTKDGKTIYCDRDAQGRFIHSSAYIRSRRGGQNQ